jgi:multiple sugar transport system ATP-binding protein
MSCLVLQGVSKTYPSGIFAVRNLDLVVEPGEFVVLVGPSGCGKTTTLRLIAGLESPSEGTISINGKAMNGVPPRDRGVAMVFQRFALLPNLSVRRNLSFAANLRHGTAGKLRETWRKLLPGRETSTRTGRSEVERRVEDVAKLLGLEGLLCRRPFELSGGEQQRVALGRALVRQPLVMLLDEPLSNLDAHLRQQLRHELHLFQRRNRATMVYVTHDQSEAMALADRLGIMSQGEIRQLGRPADIYDRPRDRFVAEFIGWPPMNFLDGRISFGGGGGLALETSIGSLSLAANSASRWSRLRELQEVTLGVRPEDVTIESGENPGKPALRIALVEQLGRLRVVTLERDGICFLRLIASGETQPRVGQLAQAKIAMDRVYFFEKSSGAAIDAGEPYS